MSLNAAALRKMLDKGLTLGDALEIAEAIEEGYARATPMVDVAAERRRAKDRERKRNVRGMSAECPRISEERVPPTPPSENNPLPPLKGEVSPIVEAVPPEKPNAETAKPLSFWVSALWEITPRIGRERSGRQALEKSLKAAIRRGDDPAVIRDGVAGYYAGPDATKAQGQFAQGVHIVVSSGKWEAFVEDKPDAGPDPPDTDPWPKRLREFRRNGFWNATDWGPKPGKPGCLAPKALLDQAA